MKKFPVFPFVGSRPSRALRIGFLPLTDCAPIVMAHELGRFAQHDLDVQLRRERDWGVLRDKLIEGELDAIHAPATFPFLTPWGSDSEPWECVTGLVLSLQGNAITLSSALGEFGIRDLPSLSRHLLGNRGRWGKRLSFGVPHAASTHVILLRDWLKSGGIDVESGVRIVTVPPMEMYPQLKLGYLDGYCVGEPWNSVAVESGAGFCVATSAGIAPLHPEKVLLVRREFAEQRADEHVRLLAALIESCRFCDVPKNWSLIRGLLTNLHYVNAPADCLLAEPGIPFDPDGATVPSGDPLPIFHRHRANAPTQERAQWLLDQLVRHRMLPRLDTRFRNHLLGTFRISIFGQAMALAEELSRAPERDVPCVPAR